MGRTKATKAGKPRRERPTSETHEPHLPLPGWPDSHVTSELTDADVDADECVAVTIHGVRHHLHSTTARELMNSLGRTGFVHVKWFWHNFR